MNYLIYAIIDLIIRICVQNFIGIYKIDGGDLNYAWLLGEFKRNLNSFS